MKVIKVMISSIQLQLQCYNTRSGFHVFGHSWGTIVATLYAASKPPGDDDIVDYNDYKKGEDVENNKDQELILPHCVYAASKPQYNDDFYRTQVYLGSDLWVQVSVTN